MFYYHYYFVVNPSNVQSQMKEYQADMEDARHARDEIFQSAKDNERKLKAMETELMTLQEVCAENQ